MKKVLSVRTVTVALLSIFIAFCVAWGGISLFSPVFGSAEGTESETTAPTVAEIVEGYKDKLIDDNIVDGEITPIVLSGTREEIAAKWTEWWDKAKSTAKYIYLQLGQDWLADPVNGFGSGNGFATGGTVGTGAIDVSGGVKIILDLNGFILSRNLSSSDGINGVVINIASNISDLVIVDSNPAKKHEGMRTVEDPDNSDGTIEVPIYSYLKKEYDENGDAQNSYVEVTGGLITGGYADASSQYGTSQGAAVKMYNGHLHLYGGTIYGNYCRQNGGGVQINGSAFPTEADNVVDWEYHVIVDGGNIIGNTALNNGGAISAVNTTSIAIRNGNIFGNGADVAGGAVYSNSRLKISGGFISYNFTAYRSGRGQGGGVYLFSNGYLDMSGGEISHNTSFQAGGVYVSPNTEINVARFVMSGGRITYNHSSSEGGGIMASSHLRLEGGTISFNIGQSWGGDQGSGIRFMSNSGGNPYRLELAGPVELTQNGGTPYRVGRNLTGSCTVIVDGDLMRGTGVDLMTANICISDSYCPIAGYLNNDANRDENSQPIAPGTYFTFTYEADFNPDDVILNEKNEVIYSARFTTHYMGSSDGKTYNTEITDLEGAYGTTVIYGDQGEYGFQVRVLFANSSGGSSARDFDRYAYDENKLTADPEDLGEPIETYIDIIKDAGIYISDISYWDYNQDDYIHITVRVIVRPKTIEGVEHFSPAENVTIEYENAAKVFTGIAQTPKVTSVAIKEGEDQRWIETLLQKPGVLEEDDDTKYAYTVEYENNIHVAGDSYVVVKGIGNYGGTVKLPFDITQPSGHTYTENGDADCATEWQVYNGAAWTAASGPSAFTYDDTSKKYNVRALVKSKFDDGTVYSSYVYAAGSTEADRKLATGDTVLTDPGLKLVFKKGESAVEDIFDAGTYKISVECVDTEKGLSGDFALPTGTIGSDIVMAPFSITKEQLTEAAIENDISLLAVVNGDEYLPFITEVEYIADGIAADGHILFGYVLYNGKEFAVALNPDFKINIEMLGRGFINYVTGVSYKHTVSGVETTTLRGEINKIVTVVTEITFTLNDNFVVTDGGASGNTGTIEKTWSIVTKHNSLAFGEAESSFAYGENGAAALPVQGIEGNAMIITFAKAANDSQYTNVASVYYEDGKLYESVAGGKGEAISGTLREYFDGTLFKGGIGKYRVTATALDYVSNVEGENGAIYYAAPATAEFTVTARSISDEAVSTAVSTDGLVYTGAAVEADVEITFNGVTLEKGVDYTLVYDNNVHAGDSAKVSIKGIGNYAGDIERMYAIAKATDNEWTVSLNIASWVTGKFNRNISVVTGRTKYGTDTLSFSIEPSQETAGKLTQDVLDALESIEVQNGKVTAATESVLRKLPVGEYTLKAAMVESADYNAISGEYAFNVLSEQYIEPSLNVISSGATQNQVYTGNLLSMNIRNFDAAAMSVEYSGGLYFDVNGGTVYATNAGTYTVKLSLISDECTWMDGTTDDITLTWTIAPRVVKAPDPDDNKFIVNGSIQSYMPQGFDPTLMRIENNERSDAGKTYVTVYLKDNKNYVWDDGTNGARVFSWEIETADWIFITIACVLAGAVLITVLFALGQFFKHRARMKDLAEAEKANGAYGDDKGGNA